MGMSAVGPFRRYHGRIEPEKGLDLHFVQWTAAAALARHCPGTIPASVRAVRGLRRAWDFRHIALKGCMR
jgi:hypothetical protein